MESLNRKRIILIASIIVFAAVMAAGISFAWITILRTSLIMVTGDAKISVTGRFGVYSELEWEANAELSDSEKYPNVLNADVKNKFGGDDTDAEPLNSNDFIAFHFIVKNESTRDANLSIRFSDFSEYVFDGFMTYYQEYGVNVTDFPSNKDEITAAAESNTAKLAYVIDKTYYKVGDSGQMKQINGGSEMQKKYLWEFSYGNRFLQAIPIPAEGYTNVYFALSNNLSTVAIEAYRAWMSGHDDGTGSRSGGYGQDRCANFLGYASYESITGTGSEEKKQIIDDYLDYFYNLERASINPDDGDLSRLNLDLRYFEFIGENASI